MLRNATLLAISAAAPLPAQDPVLIEAEAFDHHGGWVLDTQFVHSTGSPYLLAHGLGQPVEDATTEVEVPRAGRYRVWVRTLDWVGRWNAPGAPGRFEVWVDGARLPRVFGIEGAEWGWHDGGVVTLDGGRTTLRLRDLAGFDGRCDAILLSADLDRRPPDGGEALAALRAKLRGPAPDGAQHEHDLVVIGGGYGGIAAAISAARMGCRVALLQNRGVLGGNGSSEVRVWSQGGIRRGLYPRLGEIVEEFCDNASESPGRADEFGDAKKEALVRAESGIDLFLHHHADRVVMHGATIAAVEAFDVRSGHRRRFAARLFADCTGHGSIGALAGADHTVRETEHLGMSNMWRWEHTDEATEFPPTPWALQLTLDDFPYPHGRGEWFWESGFDQHPITALEATRDWNLRAVFAAFQAMKSGARADEHANARLTWVAYIGGTRESRQLLGDVVLSREDIVTKRSFDDGCVPTTWDIDLHYPREQYAKRYPDNPFISRAHFDRSVDRRHGYPVPYRCFYSRNIDNLLMAGRCISVTHEALGTVRVMRTGGMIGEVVGKAAAICVAESCTPRQVYGDHLSKLQELMRLPGRARRLEVTAPITVPPPAPGQRDRAAADVPGIVVDDDRAELVGDWQESQSVAGFIGARYLHDGNRAKGAASARFVLRARESGPHRLGLCWTADQNRASRVGISIRTTAGEQVVHVDMRTPPTGEDGFDDLTTLHLDSGHAVVVTISNAATDGHVIVDAARLLHTPQ